MKLVFKKILLFTIGLIIFPSLSHAATTLNPGDLMIISVNSDTSYPGGVNSNAFDFVSKVDIAEGTEVYFTDVGWAGTAWRNPSSEGVLRYTAPVGGITRGTIVRYDDSLATAAPWTRLSLNSTTGALTSGGSYDPAATGDNILVFQGATLSPSFIYGIGWGNNNPWLTTGTASANDSYIPSGISVAANTVVTLGNLDNYQYNCSITGLLSSSLNSSVSLGSNWNSNDTSMFGSSPCIFDAINPRVNSITRFNPLSSTTNESSVTFRVEFSEAVVGVSATDFILSSGSLAAVIGSVSTVSSSVYNVTVQGYSGDGDINLDISATNDIYDLAGNPLSNLVIIGSDESFTINTIPDTATTLAPGDIMIITVNSDASYPSGVDSNAFDFVSRVDIAEGTEIYFTDVGWTGTTWRNPSAEGVLRYTAPVGGITRGTVVRYDDSLSATAPWTRLSLNSTTGALTSGGSYDPAATGDNILVFQGLTLSPNFIYGIGWGSSSPWITTGTASTNNSYIPGVLSGAASTLVTLGNLDNYQYNCSITGLFSPNLISSIALATNWNVNDTIMFGPSSCIFDANEPRANTITRQNPLMANTNSLSLVFRVEFSEAVTNVSVADFVLSSGSLTSTINSISSVSSTVYDISVQGYSGDGTINIDISATNDIKDVSGNPLNNLVVVGADESFTIDVTPDAAPATPDLITASDTGSSSSDNVTTDVTPSFTLSCVTGSTVTIYNNGTPLTPTGVCSGGTITLTPSLSEGTHSITATQTDTAGNTSATSAPVLVVIIDVTSPTTPGIQSVGGDTTSPYITNDTTPAVIITTEVGDTVTIPGFTCTPTPATGLSVTCTPTTAYPEGVHSITPTITDTAGNTTIGTSASFTVDITAPTSPVVTSPGSYVDNYTPTITGTGEIGSFITLVLNGNTYNTTVSAAGTWSVVIVPALTDGNYPYAVTAADMLGNTSSQLNTSLTVSTTPQSSSSSLASAIRYVCKDPQATNYESFGRHQASLCKYSTTTTPVTTDNPFGGEQCPSNQLITDNMKNGDTNGVYSSYNQGKVSQVSILQAHINRILGNEYTLAAGPVDDYFRTKTKLGVERLQQRLNKLLPSMKPLVIDGIVGAYTKAAINMSC